ncbi:extracellular solute-binding protein [Streptomyces sp. TS71-3]|uniref:extracellular solute-binding protein n=1 Tax=Streptomyces sp. TS71-3 TaxID=2733862 RepID=UPI001B2D4C16|nr:extracellular solute-binding protein [Streptomyces sp. TS71-3]GHJ41982.1 iron ABC transporter substrate-binding protein [Streptomyces sp. TS71-3]
MKSVRKTITAAATVLVTGLMATGCTSPVAAGGQGGTGSTKSLVVYSNSVSDGRGDWLKKEAGKAGFKLQFVDLGGGDIRNRLLAEQANPIADVTFGLNNVYFENLKKEDVLAPYTPSWAGKVDASAGDPTGKEYWPIVREPVMLVYDKAAYSSPAQAPSDWPDLWTEKQFAKRYEVPADLGGATAQMVLAGILSRYRDDKGDLGVSKAGWDAVKAYFHDGVPAVADTDLYARMASRKVDAGQMWLAGKATREQQYKVTTEAVHPKIGVPMTVQQVGLVKGTKKAADAKKFIDWFGSATVQAAWSKQFHTMPTNKDALAQADPAAVSDTNSFTEQDIDWSFVAEHLDQWIEKVELDYLGS